MLAELSIAQAASSAVAGVLVFVFTSATGAPFDVSVGLMCWGFVSGVAVFWAWRRGVRARIEQILVLETARSRGLLGG